MEIHIDVHMIDLPIMIKNLTKLRKEESEIVEKKLEEHKKEWEKIKKQMCESRSIFRYHSSKHISGRVIIIKLERIDKLLETMERLHDYVSSITLTEAEYELVCEGARDV